MTLSRFARLTFLVAAFCGCSSVPRIVSEYKIDVQQGNVLTQDMVSQLRPGLTKDQVRFILGTPVLMDMFHANRWEYVYRLQKGSTGAVEMRKFSVFFDASDKLVSVSGDVMAAQAADASAVPESRTREIDLGSIAVDSVAPPLEEKGFFGKMRESVGF
ncbi:outer membrane protein assembly factor BamE [Propionivibrio sp.]|uniref:outer membrane protein assembly factor BamE n=1 Tax=Propionivibrio sp. TaxID=2212460 RepID=UPI0026239C4D|nr:outer membrane protein assembly factor BamE [Propionivibrio sp.]